MSYNKEAQKRYYEKHKKKIIKRQTERNKWEWKEYYTEYQREYYKLMKEALYFKNQNGHTN